MIIGWNPKIFFGFSHLIPHGFGCFGEKKNLQNQPLKEGQTRLHKNKVFSQFLAWFGRILGSVLVDLGTVLVAEFWQHNTMFLALFCAEISAPIYRQKAIFFTSQIWPKNCAICTFSSLGGRPSMGGRGWDQFCAWQLIMSCQWKGVIILLVHVSPFSIKTIKKLHIR